MLELRNTDAAAHDKRAETDKPRESLARAGQSGSDGRPLGSQASTASLFLPTAQFSPEGVVFSSRGNPGIDRVSERGREVTFATTDNPRENARRLQSTIDAAISSGGDVAVRVPAGVYQGNIAISERARNLTIRGDDSGGRRPVFDMSGVRAPEDNRGVFNVHGGTNIAVENIEISNYRVGTGDSPVAGVVVQGPASGIQLRRLWIHDMGQESRGSDRSATGAQAIAVVGVADGSRGSIKDILIEDNVIDRVKLGYHEAISVVENVNGAVIRNNRLSNLDNIGICIEGKRNVRPTNFVVAGNLVDGTRNDGGRNLSYNEKEGEGSSAGIQIDGAGPGLVTGNWLRNGVYGIVVEAEVPGARSQGIDINNNVLSNNIQAGLKFDTSHQAGSVISGVRYGSNISQRNGTFVESDARGARGIVDAGNNRTVGADWRPQGNFPFSPTPRTEPSPEIQQPVRPAQQPERTQWERPISQPLWTQPERTVPQPVWTPPERTVPQPLWTAPPRVSAAKIDVWKYSEWDAHLQDLWSPGLLFRRAA
jgi:pectin methylesterase-like acyl-CoA thioesterase